MIRGLVRITLDDRTCLVLDSNPSPGQGPPASDA